MTNLLSIANEVVGQENDDEEDSVFVFLSIESFVAIAAEKNSVHTVWFLKVIENDFTGTGHEIDDYGHSIAASVKFMKGQFFEKKMEKSSSQLFFNFQTKLLFLQRKCFIPFR